MCNHPMFHELDSHRVELFARFPKEAYTDPAWKGKTPYQVLGEASRENTIRMRIYAGIMLGVAEHMGLEVRQQIVDAIHALSCRGGEIVELIEDAMWFDQRRCKLMSLQCGLGKSTAISYVIRDVLEYGEDMGLLVVTDNLERLQSYLAPTRDEELASFLKANESRITLLDSTNKAEAMQRMRSTPVLLMTTQRYFSLTREEINGFLEGDRFRRRYTIIDEKPILKTVETVSRTDVNKVSSALCDGLPSYEKHDDKKQMIALWEKIRAQFMADIQKCEDEHVNVKSFFVVHGGMPEIDAVQLDAFEELAESHAGQLKKYDPECLGRIQRILEIVRNGGLIYGDEGQYYKSCFYTVANRSALVDGVQAHVLILDGTGDIHPDYDHQCDPDGGAPQITMQTKDLPIRRMENLTLRFVNVDASKSRLNNEDRKGKHKQAILRYLEAVGIDKDVTPLFTYKDCENWFRNRGFQRTGHFGDIKGRNSYADASSIVQIGVNLFAQQDYLTLWLADHPEERTRILQLPAAQLNEALKALQKDESVIDLQNRILMAELEQNMYRCAIRRKDFTGQAVFWVLCETNRHRVLIDMARQRYAPLGVRVEVVTSTPVEISRAKVEVRKAKSPERGTAPQRFMKWYQKCERGRSVTRKQILEEAHLTEEDWKNLVKRKRTGAYYNEKIGPLIEGMHIGRDQYRLPLRIGDEG